MVGTCSAGSFGGRAISSGRRSCSGRPGCSGGGVSRGSGRLLRRHGRLPDHAAYGRGLSVFRRSCWGSRSWDLPGRASLNLVLVLGISLYPALRPGDLRKRPVGEAESVCGGITSQWRHSLLYHAPSHPAQHLYRHHHPGHPQFRFHDPSRSRALFSGTRDPTSDTQLGNDDCLGKGLHGDRSLPGGLALPGSGR